MSKKRGTGEGNVYKRSDGRWVGRLSLGFDENGKRLRKVVYGLTQKEVNGKLDNLKQQRKHGAKSIVGKDTLAGYLQRWLEDDVAVNLEDNTYDEYERVCRLYINPFVGHIKLKDLTSETLIGWQAKLSRKNFSANMRSRGIKTLTNALSRAVQLRLLPFNPCAALNRPKVIRKETIPLEPEQCHKLFDECEKHRLGDAIILAAMTGLRRGELFALEWSAVNLSEAVLVVRKSLQDVRGKLKVKEPKTAAGRRVVTLDARAIEALRNRLKKAQDEGFEPGQVPLVFPNNRGGYLRGSAFATYVWYPIRKVAGIPDSITFHDLRHTQASLLLAAGVDLKVIQKRLGHKKFETTANIYSHLLQNSQHEAVDKLSNMMEKTAPKKRRTVRS